MDDRKTELIVISQDEAIEQNRYFTKEHNTENKMSEADTLLDDGTPELTVTVDDTS